MQPMMRIVLPIIGLLIAASLGSPASRAFDLLLGAAVGFLIADLGVIRTRLDAVAQEFDRLKKEFRRRQDAPTASVPPRETTPEPARSATQVQPDRPWQDIEAPAHDAMVFASEGTTHTRFTTPGSQGDLCEQNEEGSKKLGHCCYFFEFGGNSSLICAVISFNSRQNLTRNKLNSTKRFYRKYIIVRNSL